MSRRKVNQSPGPVSFDIEEAISGARSKFQSKPVSETRRAEA